MTDEATTFDTPAAPSRAKQIKPRCHIPWQQMVIDSTGAAVPCCYWGAYENDNPPLGNINEQSIDQIWNGAGFRKLREAMAAGDLATAGCANCYAIKQGMGLAFEYDRACESETGNRSKYALNIETLRGEIAAGKTVLEAKPTIVSFTPSHRCNIRCTHCYQESTRTEEIGRERAQDEVVALAPYLVRLVAGGGEPFLLPIWNKFLTNFDLKDNPYLDFATSTNATIVSPTILEGLMRFKKLTISVSLDGTGRAYDKVRVGANFENVVKNIRKLRQVVGGAESHESALGVSMCVMKSNILDLPNFIRFNAEEGLAFGLSPVTTLPPDESLRCFNDKEKETAGWSEALDAAEQLVQEVYLPAMVKLRNENEVQQVERDFWKLNFELLRKATDTTRETAHRVAIEVPARIQAYCDIRPRAAQTAYFFRVNDHAPRYWAPVIDGVAKVSLPAGSYFMNLDTKWTPAIYQSFFKVDVKDDGRCTLDISRNFPRIARLDAVSDTVARVIAKVQAPAVTAPVAKSKQKLYTIKLPPEVKRHLPFVADEKNPATSILFEFGKINQSSLAKSTVEGAATRFSLVPGKYCIGFSRTTACPGYWDVVRFHVKEDAAEDVIEATYHHVTAYRILDSCRRRLRKYLVARS